MSTKVKDEDGQLVEVQKNGETIWRKDQELNRDKISEASRQALLDAVVNQNGDKFRRHVFEILTGQTVEEAQK